MLAFRVAPFYRIIPVHVGDGMPTAFGLARSEFKAVSQSPDAHLFPLILHHGKLPDFKLLDMQIRQFRVLR